MFGTENNLIHIFFSYRYKKKFKKINFVYKKTSDWKKKHKNSDSRKNILSDKQKPF
jgi:hypothetical protein